MQKETFGRPFLINLKNLDSLPEVFSKRGVLQICSKFTGEHPCKSVTSIKLKLAAAKNEF